jgi:uncharacterized Zn finger protein
MKVIKYEAGQTVEMNCSACDSDKPHTVQTVTKLGKMTKAVCDECETLSTFRRGKKVSVDMQRSKAGAPYNFGTKYRKGQAIMHPTFGQGEVTAVVDGQKIDVLFGDDVKRLIHAQEA